jgi:nucleotide-binding universal stress UspA family protein
MNDHPIIWATDFSTSSDRALRWAESLAHDLRTTLIMLHVEPGQPTTEFGSIYKGLPDPNISDLAMALAAIKPKRADVLYEHRIRAGDAAPEIVAEAKECDAAAIVIGSHGRTGMRKLLLGSVAEAVLRTAPCPVMVCKC